MKSSSLVLATLQYKRVELRPRIPSAQSENSNNPPPTVQTTIHCFVLPKCFVSGLQTPTLSLCIWVKHLPGVKQSQAMTTQPDLKKKKYWALLWDISPRKTAPPQKDATDLLPKFLPQNQDSHKNGHKNLFRDSTPKASLNQTIQTHDVSISSSSLWQSGNPPLPSSYVPWLSSYVWHRPLFFGAAHTLGLWVSATIPIIYVDILVIFLFMRLLSPFLGTAHTVGLWVIASTISIIYIDTFVIAVVETNVSLGCPNILTASLDSQLSLQLSPLGLLNVNYIDCWSTTAIYFQFWFWTFDYYNLEREPFLSHDF